MKRHYLKLRYVTHEDFDQAGSVDLIAHLERVKGEDTGILSIGLKHETAFQVCVDIEDIINLRDLLTEAVEDWQ